MHLEADRDALVECSQAVLRVVSPRATHPVLGGVRISASDGRVELAATDLEIFVAVTEEFATEEGGVAVLPGKLVAEGVAGGDASDLRWRPGPTFGPIPEIRGGGS